MLIWLLGIWVKGQWQSISVYISGVYPGFSEGEGVRHYGTMIAGLCPYCGAATSS